MIFQCVDCDFQLDLLEQKYYLCPNCGSKMYQKKVLNKLQVGNKGVKAVLEQYQKRVDKDKLEELIAKENKITKKANKAGLRKVKDYIKALFSLVKNNGASNYNKTIAGGALLYLLNPMDFIPDFILGFGLMDDLVIIMIAVSIIGTDLNKYLTTDSTLSNNLFYLIQPKSDYINNQYTEQEGVRVLYLHPDQLDEFGLQILNNNLIQTSKLYVGHPYFYKILIPCDRFDQYISNDLIDEEISLLAALGAKKVKYQVHNFEQLSLSGEVDFNLFDQIIAGEVKARKRGYKYTKQEKSLEFNQISNYNLNQLEELVWYFTHQNQFNDIIKNRVLTDLTTEEITLEYSTSNFLNLDTRTKINLKADIDGRFKMSNVIHKKVNYKVKFYPRPQVVENNPQDYYKQAQTKLRERRIELKDNYKKY
ncbi:hypothetical protein Halha_0878 [Halobacteroides halobius DSM 5150]|uniref:DUF1232 domain-containing protein n=1 Tax=Halobacteroides halobius (strain ATCC 35273 / DSM 5150 / MD-1) TaxID=748449 RepID=L0K927_HALHC|nr:YkvA family protein [Halobacteroides halobius]AGB40844.1 hypothetical protein Halha_0878 [Halobacteroides halobius DSM 5150]